jgi:hypothetical protein
MRNILTVVAANLLCVLTLNVQTALAANATMSVSPQTGSYGAPFTASIVIDGHGDRVNAAQATISVSSGVVIRDLVLGDCNFSFLHTPTTQDPSFAGVILKGSTTKCTVYRAMLVPVAKGQASLSLSKTSVRRYGDAAEVLSSTKNGVYTVTAVSAGDKSSVLSSKTAKPTENGLYTVVLKVLTGDNRPVTGADVILSAVAKKHEQKVRTDNMGTVHLPDLEAGVYDATVIKDNAKVGESIINVKGTSHVLTLGINLDDQKMSPLPKNQSSVLGIATTSPFVMVGLLAAGIVIGTGIALLAIKLKGR